MHDDMTGRNQEQAAAQSIDVFNRRFVHYEALERGGQNRVQGIDAIGRYWIDSGALDESLARRTFTIEERDSKEF
jgi:hypothetical protein